MPRQPLERVTLIDSLVEQLEKRIMSGEYSSGSRLPGEDALADYFAVSRPVIREGLSRLRERGYVETVSGKGTFVRLPDVDHLSDQLLRHIRIGSREGYSVANLYEARTTIESTAARLAATRADELDIAALNRRLEEMRRCQGDPRSYTAADVGFHIDVANAAKNPFLAILLAPLTKVIVRGILESSNTSAKAVTIGIRAHEKVLQRIADHDPTGAEEAMIAHLADSRRIFPKEVLAKLRILDQ